MTSTNVPSGVAAADPRYTRFKDALHRTVVDVVDLSVLHTWSEERLQSEIRDLARKVARDMDRKLPPEWIDSATSDVLDEVFGLGPVEPLFRDKTISEILVNGPDNVFIERDGLLQRVPIHFTDNAHLVRVIQRVASRVGRRIDESSPMVDARLADGSRVNAVLPPLTIDGPVLSIRRFGSIYTAEDLIKRRSLTTEMAEFLEAAVAARINTLISGGTGGGKTTLLNVLSGYIGKQERLVTIEDTVELQLQQKHVVRMETRTANMEGFGSVNQRDLLRNALRMRPDRIILGECRGAEAVDMLQAMNTGHEGSLTTVHANDTKDALNRLELMVGLSGMDVPTPILRGYIGSAIHLIVHVSRLAGGARKVTRISELVGRGKRGGYVVRDIFHFDQTGVENGQAVGVFRSTGYVPKFSKRLAAMGHKLPERLFARRDLLAIGAGPASRDEPTIAAAEIAEAEPIDFVADADFFLPPEGDQG